MRSPITEAALRLNPDNPELYQELCEILAEHPNTTSIGHAPYVTKLAAK